MRKVFKAACTAVLCAAMLLSLAACSGGNMVKTSGTSKLGNAGNGKKVYFAGPLFNQGEKDFNERITKVLESHGYQVFLPQRDGIEAARLEGKSEEEIEKIVFELDEREVRKADIIFMSLDGRVPDEGACVELGIAYGAGKRCYGFKTDTRVIEKNMDINPMISGCMKKIFRNIDGDKLVKEIEDYLSENEL